MTFDGIDSNIVCSRCKRRGVAAVVMRDFVECTACVVADREAALTALRYYAGYVYDANGKVQEIKMNQADGGRRARTVLAAELAKILEEPSAALAAKGSGE